MIKCFLPRNVVYEERTCCSSVIAASNTFERFLARRVPNLQFYILIINFNRTTAELHTDCQIMLLSETLVCELKKQARFSDTYIKRNEPNLLSDSDFTFDHNENQKI